MHISWSTSSARSKGGRSKKERVVSLLSLSPSPFDFFPRKRLILRLERQSQKSSGEEKGTISATIPPPPPPPPTKEAKNRRANTAYVLYPKYAWEQERMILMGRNG